MTLSRMEVLASLMRRERHCVRPVFAVRAASLPGETGQKNAAQQ
jgi:hypothetical protein